jgi:hypothetical protein
MSANWYRLFESKELFEMEENHHKTNEGFQQTVEKLKAYVNQNQNKIL